MAAFSSKDTIYDMTLTMTHPPLLEKNLGPMRHTTMDSPIGRLLLVSSDMGLIKIANETEDAAQVLYDLESQFNYKVEATPKHLYEAIRQLTEYFAGTRRTFTIPLDYELTRGFRKTAMMKLTETPYGTTISYTDLASAAGRPRAVRAVGSACATNPLPIVIPCHRVVRSDGSLGGYSGGLSVKVALLNLEKTTLLGAPSST